MDTRFEGNIFDRITTWVQRAEEMSLITHKLRGDISHTFAQVRDSRGIGLCRILPTINIHRENVYCNEILIPTARMRAPMELFKTFLKDPLKAFSREELIQGILEQTEPSLRNDLLSEALGRNISKLISRTRLIAEEAVNTGSTKWIEWFPFDSERRLWSFYRLTSHYLMEKQGDLMRVKSTPTFLAQTQKV